MTTPGGGGDRLDVPVVADATGFSRDAKRKIDDAARAVRARVAVEVDAKRLQVQLAQQVKLAERTTQIRLRVGVDGEHLRQSIDRALAALGKRDYRIKVGVDVDTGKVVRAMADASQGGQARVKVDADTAPARESVERFRQESERRPVKVSARVDLNVEAAMLAVERARARLDRVMASPTASATDRRGADLALRQAEQALAAIQKRSRAISPAVSQALSGLGRLGLAVGKLAFAAPAVSALAGGLGAVAAAASQAVGVVGALPGLVGAAAQGLGVMVAGFSGVGDAVKQLGNPAAASGGGVASSAKTQEAAQRRIAEAHKAVQKAQESADRAAQAGARAVTAARQRVADTVARAAERVAAAEARVTAANKAAARATADLTRARELATEKLEDYKLSLSGAALDEEAATLAVERARERWNETMRSPVATDLDRREVDLALRQAEQSLAEVKERNGDLATEAARAAAAGVEGSEEVVAARERETEAVADARDAEAEWRAVRIENARDIAAAEEELRLTIEDTNRDNADALEAVADAQANVREAIDAAAEAATAAASAVSPLATALAALSPAGQRFARFINDTLKPRLRELKFAIQEAMLPGVQEGVRRALPLLDSLQDGFVETGSIVGTFATDLGRMLGEETFRADAAQIVDNNNAALREFSGTGLNLVSILRDLMLAAGPLVTRFARWTKELTGSWAATLRAKQATGELTEFFNRAGDRAAQLGRIVRDFGVGLFNVFSEGTVTGDGLLRKLEEIAASFRSWTEDEGNRAKVREWFEQMGPLFEKIVELGGNLAETLGLIGQEGGGGLGAFLDTLNALLTGINAILAGPLGPFVVGLMQLGGVMGALGLAGGLVTRQIRNVQTVLGATKGAADFARGLRGGADAADALGSKAAGAGAKVRDLASKAGTLASTSWTNLKNGAAAVADYGKKALVAAGRVAAMTAGIVAKGIALGVTAVAQGIATAATWLFSAALWANPITWIVAGIIALIAAIWLLVANWDAVTAALGKAWQWIRDKAGELKDWVVRKFTELKDAAVAKATEVKDWVVRRFTELRDGAVQKATEIKDWVVQRFVALRDAAVQKITEAKDWVIARLVWLRDEAVRRATEVKDWVVGRFTELRDAVVDRFSTMKDRIGELWQRVKDTLRGPAQAVVDVVYNQGLRRVYNWVNDLWGGNDWPEVRFARGGVLDSRGGGTARGYAPGRDTLLAAVSPGEGFLVPEAVRALGGARGVQAINSEYSSRVPGPGLPQGDDPDQMPHFARGGVLGTVGGWLSSAGNWVSDRLGDVWDLAADGWKAAARAAVSPVRSAVNAALPGGGITGNLRDGGNRLLDRLVEAVGGKETTEGGRAGAGGTGSGWTWLRDVVQAAIPAARVNSAVRSTPDAHGRGKAVDFGYGSGPGGAGSPGLARIARFLYERFGKSLYELIYTGTHAKPGGYQVKRGRDMTYDGTTQRAHTNHVHAAVYDRGGRFPAGSIGVNLSGRDEGVLTAEGIAALGGWGPLDALNAGRPLASVVASSAAGMHDVGPRGQSIGTVIEEGAITQHVYNPVPETAGETLNARMRRLASVGIFDSKPGGN